MIDIKKKKTFALDKKAQLSITVWTDIYSFIHTVSFFVSFLIIL